MTDWTKPALTDAYASVLTELMGRDTDVATQFVGASSTSIPNGAIRWNPATYRWETYSSSGGTWAAWSAQINVVTVLLGGNAAPGTFQAIPISQADGRYQAAGSYAALGGLGTQVFLAANAAAGTQQVVPRAQADGLYALAAGTASNTFYVNSGANSGEGDIGAMTAGEPNAYLYNAAAAWGLYSPGAGGAILSYTRAGTVVQVGGALPITITAGTLPGHAATLGQLATYAALATANTFTKSQAATVQAIAYAATITLDLTAGNDAAVTLTGAATLANPSAMTPGTSGHIAVTQDATGGRTLAYGSYWKFGQSGVPTLSTAANAEDVLVYWVRDSTHIIASIVQGVQ